MKVIMQCAGSKAPEAGFLRTGTGQPVMFVAHPDQLPPSEEWVCARPDDPSDVPEQSWRQRLVTYNDGHNNPFGLLEAYHLYRDPVYEELVKGFGAASVFILSAGWGLVRAAYLLPVYDITFTRAEPYKRRRRQDKYDDFCHIQGDATGPIVFFGTKNYLPLLQRLTHPLRCDKVFFYRSADPPSELPGWRAKRFATPIRTNWHYACAKAFLRGKVSI